MTDRERGHQVMSRDERTTRHSCIMRHMNRVLRLSVLILLCVPGAALAAARHEVASLADLQARLDAAMPGDVIVVKDGRYTTRAPIVVRRPGSCGSSCRDYLTAGHSSPCSLRGLIDDANSVRLMTAAWLDPLRTRPAQRRG